MKNCHNRSHVGILTYNFNRMLNFYTEILGFKKEKLEIIPGSVIKPIFGIASGCKFMKLKSDNLRVEIFQPLTGRVKNKPRGNPGFNHCSLLVKNRENFVQRLKAKKVKIIRIERDNRSIYFLKDPDGNLIEIQEAMLC